MPKIESRPAEREAGFFTVFVDSRISHIAACGNEYIVS